MILDWATFSAAEWEAMTADQWGTFALDPVAVSGGGLYVVAVQIFTAGAVAVEVHA